MDMIYKNAKPMTNFFLPERLEVLKYWIREREHIRINKEVTNRPKPWTTDPLMANTRWCNVRRMDDKVSRWLMRHFYCGQLDDTSAVTAAAVARLINWPDTIEYLYPNGWEYRWDPDYVMQRLLERKLRGEKVFTGVYIINAAYATDLDRATGGAKISVVVRTISNIHTHRHELIETDSMCRTWLKLLELRGMGRFIAGQIVADLRHVMPGEWGDRYTWAPQGPGSTRGLAWLVDKPKLSAREFDFLFYNLVPVVRGMVPTIWKHRKLEAHDVQNCLCELSKLVRLRNGGRSKNKYEGGL